MACFTFVLSQTASKMRDGRIIKILDFDDKLVLEV